MSFNLNDPLSGIIEPFFIFKIGDNNKIPGNFCAFY